MKSILTITLLGMLGGALPSTAATMFAKWTGYSGGNLDMSLDSGTNWSRVGGGLFTFERTTGGDNTDGPAVGQSFVTICIEPTQSITTGIKEWEIGTLAGGNTTLGSFTTTQQNLLLELFGRYLPDFAGNALSNQEKIALQAAVWEIVSETSGTLQVSAGTTRFKAESVAGTLVLATSYLNSLDGTGDMATGIRTMLREKNQDYAFQIEAGPPQEVPEPAHLLGGDLRPLALRKRLG